MARRSWPAVWEVSPSYIRRRSRMKEQDADRHASVSSVTPGDVKSVGLLT